MKISIAVFFGCRSVEHEVSIISAVQAMRAADREKYELFPVYVAKSGAMFHSNKMFEIENFRDIEKLISDSEEVTFLRRQNGVFMHPVEKKAFKKVSDIKIDLAFPIVHGTNCEDGTVAGYFEFLGLPYISSDIISAAVGMDKAVFKDVLKNAGLPVLDCVRFTSREYMLDAASVTGKIKDEVGFPLIIKPVNLGSSVGISKVETPAGLDDAVRLAASFADNILAERAVLNLREINCSVLGDEDSCIASVCEEPFMHDEILSYKDKYEGGAKEGPSKGMASLGRKIPADIPDELSEKIKDISCRIFKAIGASGVVRIDYLLDGKTGDLYANEINTIPGSLAFYLWEASGMSYRLLIDKLVDIAFRRERKRDNLKFTIDTNILSGVSFGSKGSKGSKI